MQSKEYDPVVCLTLDSLVQFAIMAPQCHLGKVYLLANLFITSFEVSVVPGLSLK